MFGSFIFPFFGALFVFSHFSFSLFFDVFLIFPPVFFDFFIFSNGPLPPSDSAGPPPLDSLRRTSLRRTAQNFALFLPSPAPIFALFPSLWGSSRGILVVFEEPGASSVHVWSSRAVMSFGEPPPLGLHTSGPPPFGPHPPGRGVAAPTFSEFGALRSSFCCISHFSVFVHFLLFLFLDIFLNFSVLRIF